MADVSSALGEYMLKGWVLTDDICTRCNATPFLRSSTRSTPQAFCASCDKTPNGSANRVNPSSSSSGQLPPPITIPASSASPSASSSSHISGNSTPPTEVSSALSSPTFAAPVETAESLRRREQSDQASSEIGQRLLKGWAMLAEECPNSRCYGVPLVRPPKPGGGKDIRKVCVICNSTYVMEVDSAGWERLVPYDNRPVESSIVDVPRDESTTSSSATPSRAQTLRRPVKTSTAGPQTATIFNEMVGEASPLDASAQSLELALTALSNRLTVLSNSTTGLDVKAITDTADAIGRTTAALSHVRELKRAELANS